MTLGSTQPLTEMSTRNLPGGKGRPAPMADNLTAICEPTVQEMWEPRRLTTLLASTACYRDSFIFLRTQQASVSIVAFISSRTVPSAVLEHSFMFVTKSDTIKCVYSVFNSTFCVCSRTPRHDCIRMCKLLNPLLHFVR
jgi:hypothetical protein